MHGPHQAIEQAIDLGAVRILDTRRFNERLVIYTDLTLEDQQSIPSDGDEVIYYEPRGTHRSLRIFTFGDTLTEEMTDTLIDTTPSALSCRRNVYSLRQKNLSKYLTRSTGLNCSTIPMSRRTG